VDGVRRRGLASAALEWAAEQVAVRVLRYAVQKGVEWTIQRAAELFERGREGPVPIRGVDPAEWTVEAGLPELPGPVGRAARVLLFVHGTFSSTVGDFGPLALGAGHAALERAIRFYDLVLGYDHHTLQRDPRDNAKALADLLVTHAWGDEPPVLDVVCFSRGGLVVRWLIEHELRTRGWDAQVARVLFVAASNGGTLLADPDHRAALDAIPAEGMPRDWALWKGGEGRVLAAYYLYLGQADHIDDAFACFDAALARVDQEVDPRLWRDLQRRKGEAAHACESWTHSYDAHAAVLAVGDALYAEAATPDGRAGELRKARGAALLGSYAAARLKEREGAVRLAEWGRARGGIDALMAAEVSQQAASPELRDAVAAARAHVLDLEARLRAEGADPLEQMRATLADALGVDACSLGLRRIDGGADGAAEARAEMTALLGTARGQLQQVLARAASASGAHLPSVLSAADVLGIARAAGHPIVYLLPSMHGLAMLSAVPEGLVYTMTVEGLTSEQVHTLLAGAEGLPGYLHAAMYGDEDKLAASLDVCVPVLGWLLGVLTDWLGRQGYDRAALVPLGKLGLLPLHAAAVEAGAVFRLLPSARLLGRLCRQRPRLRGGSAGSSP